MSLLLADFIYSRDCKLNLRKNMDLLTKMKYGLRNVTVKAGGGLKKCCYREKISPKVRIVL